MYDIKLKPRLLRTLIKEHVPDEKHPFRNPSELSKVVSMIKTHKLLGESSMEATDKKQVEIWTSTVDAWVERLFSLVSSSMPDKRWAGICLLGVTCQECSDERFLASYSVWFHKLLSHIQSPGDCHFVKVASCASMSDLFTRLGGFSNVKKEGTSHAGKLIQYLLQLLTDDYSEAVWEGAVCLLLTIMTFFPSSIHRHYDSAEAAIASKIISGRSSVHMLKKFSHCLALLPKSRGDEASWSLMMQKILLTINVHLNDAFQGLEDETRCREAVRLLVAPAKSHPPPLGGQNEASEKLKKRSEQSVISSISTLMLCCSTMLTNSYPVQVNVPVRPLLALIERVLMVDGSLSQSLLPLMTSMQQELICSELPSLHLHSLELLLSIIKGLRSQLLPYAADIVRLIKVYLKGCTLPELRIQVYLVIKVLLISKGLGMVVYFAQEVIDNAIIDLDSLIHDIGNNASSDAYRKAPSESLLKSSRRKRKHGSRSESFEEHNDSVNMEAEVFKKGRTSSTNLKIAALEAIECLLSVGGSLRSESSQAGNQKFWRSKIDNLLIIVATNACDGGWAKEEKSVFGPNEKTSSYADLQLASLRALLASLLSPVVRPTYLSQALDLFRRGRQETGTKLAEFCVHALLALEVLIHPRYLPLVDPSPTSINCISAGLNFKLPENKYSHDKKQNPFLVNDENWNQDGDETDYLLTNVEKNVNYPENPNETSGDPEVENIDPTVGSSGIKDSEEQEQQPAMAASDHFVMGDNKDAVMVDAQLSMENSPQENAICHSVNVGPGRTEEESANSEITPGKDFRVDKDDGLAARSENPIIFDSMKGKGSALELDDEDMDSFPDIIDAEPDSD